jgi:hypothetical protein
MRMPDWETPPRRMHTSRNSSSSRSGPIGDIPVQLCPNIPPRFAAFSAFSIGQSLNAATDEVSRRRDEVPIMTRPVLGSPVELAVHTIELLSQWELTALGRMRPGVAVGLDSDRSTTNYRAHRLQRSNRLEVCDSRDCTTISRTASRQLATRLMLLHGLLLWCKSCVPTPSAPFAPFTSRRKSTTIVTFMTSGVCQSRGQTIGFVCEAWRTTPHSLPPMSPCLVSAWSHRRRHCISRKGTEAWARNGLDQALAAKQRPAAQQQAWQ